MPFTRYYGVLNPEIQGTWKINVQWKNWSDSARTSAKIQCSCGSARGEGSGSLCIIHIGLAVQNISSAHCCWIIHWGEEENQLALWNARRGIVLLPSLTFLSHDSADISSSLLNHLSLLLLPWSSERKKNPTVKQGGVKYSWTLKGLPFLHHGPKTN